MACNASCNCGATKVLVTAAAWPQREEFLAAVREALSALSPRSCFYPGRHAETLFLSPSKPLPGPPSPQDSA